MFEFADVPRDAAGRARAQVYDCLGRDARRRHRAWRRVSASRPRICARPAPPHARCAGRAGPGRGAARPVRAGRPQRRRRGRPLRHPGGARRADRAAAARRSAVCGRRAADHRRAGLVLHRGHRRLRARPQLSQPARRAPAARGSPACRSASSTAASAARWRRRCWRALDRDVLAEKPDLVIWQLGTNSVLQRRDPARRRRGGAARHRAHHAPRART